MNTTASLPSQAKYMQEAKDRRARALALHDAGKKDREIGELFGISRQAAAKLVAKAMKEAGRA